MKNLRITLTMTLVIFTSIISANLWANNIAVSNVSLSERDITSDFTKINFNVTWNNSWRTSTNESNWDGAWIFVKFRKVRTSVWNHATINFVAAGASASGHTEGAGATIKTAADGKGVFVYRNANGIGNVNFAGNKIRWNYGLYGVQDNDSVEVRVFATEMVYVPAGPYYLGTGGAERFAFKNGNTANPYLVATADEILVSNTVGSLNYTVRFNEDASGPIPAEFPTGYGAFWLMKYETSQQQYADFLNHIDLNKATKRFFSLFTGSHPNYVAPNPERVCVGNSFADVLAYADWSGLRPYSELEYEKACRGSNMTPVAEEYAWGNTTLINLSTVSGSGSANEAPTVFANANITAVARRCGIFAIATASRDTAGATYYGVMEMSGSAWEAVIPISNPTARSFAASVHGAGLLDADGNSPTWHSKGVSLYSLRGGALSSDLLNPRVSDAIFRNAPQFVGGFEARNPDIGTRLARTGN